MFTGNGFGMFATALLGLSAITCGTLLFGGWRQRGHQLARQSGGESMPSMARPFGPHMQQRFVLGRTPFASAVLDVEDELRDVLHYMAAEPASRLVQFEFAVEPNLSVHADRFALRAVLSELVANAVRHAPVGRVLLSAI